MSEPSSLSLGVAAASVATSYGLVWRLYRKLPRWRRRRLVYNTVSFSAVKLRGDLWLASADGVDYLTTSKAAMEELLDRLDLDRAAAQRVPWPGRVKGGVRC